MLRSCEIIELASIEVFICSFCFSIFCSRDSIKQSFNMMFSLSVSTTLSIGTFLLDESVGFTTCSFSDRPDDDLFSSSIILLLSSLTHLNFSLPIIILSKIMSEEERVGALDEQKNILSKKEERGYPQSYSLI